MVFTKEITGREKSSIRLTITMACKDVRDVYDATLKDIAKTIQFKGFRKGKVPPNIVETKLKSVLQEQVLDDIIGKSTMEAFEMEDFPQDARPLPYSDPQLEGEVTLDLSRDLVFSVTYDTYPTVKIKRYEGFEIEADEAEVSEADIERELRVLQDRNSIVLDREENAPARDGDVVTIDCHELNGEGSSLSDRPLELPFTLGEHSHSFDLDEEVVGMKKDEEKVAEKTYPADWRNPELAGKTKRFKIKLLTLKEKKLPAIDDDLAQDIDAKFQTLDDLKLNIRKKMEYALGERLRSLKFERILSKIREENPIELPESMIRLERASRLGGISAGGSPKLRELLNQDSFMEQMFPHLEESLQTSLIAKELSAMLHIEAGDEDIEKEFDRIAEREGIAREEVADFYNSDPERQDSLKSGIKIQKLTGILLEKNKILPGKKLGYHDIMTDAG